jgi:hypothetical protein
VLSLSTIYLLPFNFVRGQHQEIFWQGQNICCSIS